MDTAQKILHKAHELFMLYGIRSVSMDEIAAHLSMSKKTIYQCYPDKDDLVWKVVQFEIAHNQNECQLAYKQAENPIHEIYLALSSFKKMLSTMNPLMISDLERFHPKGFKVLLEHKHTFVYQLITNNLKEGIKAGLYRKDLNLDIIAKNRISSVFQMFNQDVFPASSYTLSNVLEEITNHFVHGIVNEKGLALVEVYKKTFTPKKLANSVS